MQRVAERVGVGAPSLYKHVDNRTALLAAVAEAIIDDLAAQLESADGSLEELARRYRQFAGARPAGFRLVQSAHASPQALTRAVGPLLRASRELAGEQDALDAARLVTAWVTGFIEMEPTAPSGSAATSTGPSSTA
ncbi:MULTISPECIES: TetR/AcrR family transcriptional regulator [unclassified Streptomyces]|uniref:TetR/AcrR family transcriptional regulator n=1 Tax=unclassified Streptomyces TaxID=2593676 RepID=UPI00382E3501